MSRSRLNKALQALSGGLQSVAAYRAHREEKEDDRAFQTETMERNQAFQERLSTMGMEHQSAEAQKTRDHASSEAAEGRLFQRDLAEMQIESAEARHAQSMAATYAGIAAQADALQATVEDRDLGRKVEVLKLGVTQAASRYESLAAARQKEIEKASANPINMKPESLQAAISAIDERYSEQMATAMEEIDAAIRPMAALVGMEEGEAPSMTRSDPSASVDRDRVSRAVDMVQTQMAGQPLKSESEMVEAFKKMNLSDHEARMAARQMITSGR